MVSKPAVPSKGRASQRAGVGGYEAPIRWPLLTPFLTNRLRRAIYVTSTHHTVQNASTPDRIRPKSGLRHTRGPFVAQILSCIGAISTRRRDGAKSWGANAREPLWGVRSTDGAQRHDGSGRSSAASKEDNLPLENRLSTTRSNRCPSTLYIGSHGHHSATLGHPRTKARRRTR